MATAEKQPEQYVSPLIREAPASPAGSVEPVELEALLPPP
jgi:hypothetical protein